MIERVNLTIKDYKHKKEIVMQSDKVFVKTNSDRITNDTEDLIGVKAVDRSLSYFVVNPFSVVCDVGGAEGIDAFSFAAEGAFCICLDINKAAVRYGKMLSKKRG